MTRSELNPEEQARLQTWTFDNDLNTWADDRTYESNPKLLTDSKRHGRVFDAAMLHQDGESEHDTCHGFDEHDRYPSLKSLPLRRSHSRKHMPHVSIFREHLSSISSFRSSKERA